MVTRWSKKINASLIQLKLKEPPLERIKLELHHSHEGIFYLRDMQYIVCAMRKIAKDLPRRKHSIVWLQLYIEMALILNSRFYEDLIVDLVKEVKRNHILPDNFSIRPIMKKHEDGLSSLYHLSKEVNRNRAAHGSNYQRVGIPEFDNDILPRPLTYRPTFKPPLFNMASRKDIIKMWQSDIRQCADDIDLVLNEIVMALNELKGAPEASQTSEWELREGMSAEDMFNEIIALSTNYKDHPPLKKISRLEASKVMDEHHLALKAIQDKYYKRQST